jgi:hypothetical protein
MVQELGRAGVGPVHVVQDQREPGRGGQLVHQLPQCPVQPEADHATSVGSRVRVGVLELAERRGERGERRSQQPLLCGAEPPAELGLARVHVVVQRVDQRAERQDLLELGRAPGQRGEAPITGERRQLRQQPRLADARFADHGEELELARAGRLDHPGERPQRDIPADERRPLGQSMPRIELERHRAATHVRAVLTNQEASRTGSSSNPQSPRPAGHCARQASSTG